jgi:coenzyme F420-reducing hydrogenase delta subunit/Pyruvate/2-oxoacid:ferredoxin oxidoreductase delta subunit
MMENAHPKSPLKNAQCKDVLIFGSGVCAQKTAANLVEHGINTCIVTKGAQAPTSVSANKTNWLTATQLEACKGFAGDFYLVLNQNSTFIGRQVSAIVIAEDQVAPPNYKDYGLMPNDRIMAISVLEEKMRDDSAHGLFQDGDCIAFLCGWQIDSHPWIAQRMLYCCSQLQVEPKLSTMFMTGNLKVSANGAESLYQQAKADGAVFIKFSNSFPSIQIRSDGRFNIAYIDELTRTHFEITTDWLIVDETIGPGRDLRTLIDKLDIEKDSQGFAQLDNVHRWSHGTNRRGIFVAGGARGILPREQLHADADQVTLKVLAFLNDNDADSLPKVEIHHGRCARCLTCFRLCPHKAIDIGRRISIVSHACQSCGICSAGCPARAIDMDGMQITTDLKQWHQQLPLSSEPSEEIPKILVFGCGRSAGQAYQLNRMMGFGLPEGVRFIEVPCSGSISSRHLLAAFDTGADGVMLCTCHKDNCKSDQGNILAHKRAQSALMLLNQAGIENERLDVCSLAANMANEFCLRINGFVDRIRSLNTDMYHKPTIEDE